MAQRATLFQGFIALMRRVDECARASSPLRIAVY
jgi:hypothetical protein